MKSLIATALLAAAGTSAQAATPAPATPATTAPAKAPPLAMPSDVAALVAKLQAFYEKSPGLDTRFDQSFTQGGMPSRLGGATAKGRMRFRKPDGATGPLMRWDYDDGRILLLVKDRSWTFDPDTKQATEYRVDPGQLSAAVTFMWGKGRLAEEFEIVQSKRDFGGDGTALELTPRKPSGFSKVFLVADPATGKVSRSVVVQSNGSENHLIFHDTQANAKVVQADFDPDRAFPAGTSRVRAAVPGQ
ncbi:outer membrane lipoprotein carrier protein LolA [Vulgatibacter incomptus]|uniref:Outer membrane lipoprotein carrier protein LolA n=1 Tax=Vulgatibacter incomptus TaxID=1391653 RepID=A0A0K1P861_9BACT|nr:outer membrane lipoprotein carrier protein LolA [Vulgatibacter incomptus]AKU89621.1 hypothetical protein AKJ08_0008 [Vulgatibacter incomptus]AKU93325.1 outer membrane lipoprotein carrier protein LolA [Vulgatibacter incomptus]